MNLQGHVHTPTPATPHKPMKPHRPATPHKPSHPATPSKGPAGHHREHVTSHRQGSKHRGHSSAPRDNVVIEEAWGWLPKPGDWQQ